MITSLYDSEAINDVIFTLNEVEVDGEAMQFILERTSMESQMLRQLIMTSPLEEIEIILNEKKALSAIVAEF